MKTNFYQTYFIRYIETDNERRNATKKHWINVHAENVKSCRDDLIIFSAKILAMIDLAEKYINSGYDRKYLPIF